MTNRPRRAGVYFRYGIRSDEARDLGRTASEIALRVGPGTVRTKAQPSIVVGWGTRDRSGHLRPWCFLREENAWAAFVDPGTTSLHMLAHRELTPELLADGYALACRTFGQGVREMISDERKDFWRELGDVVPVVMVEVTPELVEAIERT